MDFPLVKRKELLDMFFGKYQFERVVNLSYQTGNGNQLFEKMAESGYEGIIAKDPHSVYMPGKRGESWLKIKSTMMQEAVICGYTYPQGSRKYFGSLILGLYENGILKYIGNCGTGFSEISLKELDDKFRLYKIDKCPFMMAPKLSWAKGKPTWLKPELVANVKFMEWSKDGIMRAPVFMGLREDKEPSEVINETREAEENPVTIRKRQAVKKSITKRKRY
jgi:bifunctional non-homologous end joining protein LigD